VALARADVTAIREHLLLDALEVPGERRGLFLGDRVVYVRVAKVGDKIYLDLCNSTWQAVGIDARGWRIVDNPPVRFRRTPGMLPLTAQVAGGSMEALEKFFNTKSKPDFVLAVT